MLQSEMFGLFFYDDFKDLRRTLPFGKALVKIHAGNAALGLSLIMSLDKAKFFKSVMKRCQYMEIMAKVMYLKHMTVASAS